MIQPAHKDKNKLNVACMHGMSMHEGATKTDIIFRAKPKGCIGLLYK